LAKPPLKAAFSPARSFLYYNFSKQLIGLCSNRVNEFLYHGLLASLRLAPYGYAVGEGAISQAGALPASRRSRDRFTLGLFSGDRNI